LQWIFAEEHFFEAKAQHVRTARMDHCLRDPRIGIDLADAGDAFVSVNEHDNVVLGRRARVTVEAGIEEYVRFDANDLQVPTMIP
jgi:hypothetical protein